MGLWTPFARSAQAQSSNLQQINNLEPTGSWLACAGATISALALVFCAASFNAGHAYELGLHHSQFRAVVLATASIAAAVLAPLCILAAARGRGFGTRILALMLGVGCIAYTSVSSLGFVASARDLGVSGHRAATEAHQDRRQLIEVARKELAGLKGQSALVVERREQLTGLLVELGKASPDAKAGAKADAQAAALGYYFRAAGWQVSDDAVGTWLNLGTVLFLELAAALSLTVAAALRPVSRGKPVGAPQTAAVPAEAPALPKPADGPVRTSGASAETPRKDKPRGRGGRPLAILPEAAVAKLRANGQAGSVRGVAKLLGTSKSTAHRTLHKLSAMGLVTLTAGVHGLSVAIA